MTASLLPLPVDTAGSLPATDEGACDACPHAVAGHDAIGLRFCRATLTGALTRGCVCRSA